MRFSSYLVALLLLSSSVGCGSGSRGKVPFAASTATTSAAATPAPAPVAAPIAAPAPVATATTAAAPAAPTTYPNARMKRLVLCMDGVPYRVMADLQRKGRFKDFFPATRQVSVFPSLSNVAWASLLDIGAEAGYQSFYFSNQLNKSVGSTSDEMLGCRFERRMHHRVEGLIAHGLDYVAPFLAGKAHLKKLIAKTLDHKGSETAFAYSLETDSCAHMRGRDKLERMLEEVDNELQDLQTKFRARTGQKLEIAIVSDHGHTLEKGKIVEIEKALEQGGYKVADELKGPKDVSFFLAGILASLAVHCQPQAAPDLARHLSHMDGADLCAFRGPNDTYVLTSTRGEALFTYDAAKDAYRYTVQSGDPIGYSVVFADLASKGKVDQAGFAKASDLFEATKTHPFPDAAVRVRRGLTDLVRSPAQVIVSLKKGYESGRGFVKLAASIVGRNGTHGSLAADDTLGVFMTNYKATPDAIRADQLKAHLDLADYKANAPSLEVAIEPVFNAQGKRTGGDMKALVRDDGRADSIARGETTTLWTTIKRKRLLLPDVVVLGGVRSDAATLPLDGPSYVIDLPNGPSQLEESKKYTVEVVLERRDAAGAVTKRETRKIEFKYNGTFQNVD